MKIVVYKMKLARICLRFINKKMELNIDKWILLTFDLIMSPQIKIVMLNESCNIKDYNYPVIKQVSSVNYLE